MPHIDEIRLLRRRSKAFLERAIDSLNSGDYDIASFLSEQAVQLYLKSLLLEKLGDYPRTHSISTLLSIIKEIPSCDRLMELLERSREIRLMEDAYIASRYLAREYTREEAEVLVNLQKRC
ncbi:MAG: DNA-binding protein [Thermoproteota archaeon]|nr:MAG: DNA-binding protein [Candidatus Korarchaeota archaeon]